MTLEFIATKVADLSENIATISRDQALIMDSLDRITKTNRKIADAIVSMIEKVSICLSGSRK